MSSEPYTLKAFKLKDGTSVAVINADGVIDVSHKLIGYISSILAKYDCVVLFLSRKSAINYTVENIFKSLKNLNKLTIIYEKDKQLGFPLGNINHFLSIKSAMKLIDGHRDVFDAINKLKSSDAMSKPVFKLLEILSSPKASLENVTNYIVSDRKLSKETVECANEYRLETDRHYSDVRSVLAYVGMEGLRLICLEEAYNLFHAMFEDKCSEKLFHMKCCMNFMGRLSRIIGLDSQLTRKMRVAGLYHDIGSLFIQHIFGEEYERIYARVAEGDSVEEAEYKLFGVSHQEIGELVGAKIGLPDYLMSAVGYHHNPDREAGIIQAALLICNGMLNSKFENSLSYTPYSKMFKVLGDEYIRMANIRRKNGKLTIEDMNNLDENDNFVYPEKLTRDRLQPEFIDEYMECQRSEKE